MKNFVTGMMIGIIPFLSIWLNSVHGQAADTNRPPQVSIVWPHPGGRGGDAFSVSTLIKIKAEAADPDGSVVQVQFFAQTNLIGVASNPPFNFVWEAGAEPDFDPTHPQGILKAVAIDDLGARGESTPVKISYFTGLPPWPDVEIISPNNGAIFAAPATFVFSAEVLAVTSGNAGPVEFFLGTNSVGIVDQDTAFTATTPPSSVTVSNLTEGEYKLMVRFRGADGYICPCNQITNTIRVVKLGVQSPGITTDGRFRFEVVTSFPGKETLIQSSPNLLDWISISTNQPSSNTFTFTAPSPATNSQRFYRVFVPPE